MNGSADLNPNSYYHLALYIDMVDNLLPSPTWWETYLLAMSEVTDGVVPAVRARALGSLLSQHYGPRGRLGQGGTAILMDLFEEVPHQFNHWETYYPREILLELLGAELGQEARDLLADAWGHYRDNQPPEVPLSGPGSTEDLDAIGLESALTQIDSDNALINEDYLAWFNGSPFDEPMPPDIADFIAALEGVSSSAAPWTDYDRYFDSLNTFVTSPVPVPPATPENDDLAIQCLFDAYTWIRTATPSSEEGGIDQQELVDQIQKFATLYIRAFGDEVDSGELFGIAPGKIPLPGIDTAFLSQRDLFAGDPAVWDTWLAEYDASRTTNLSDLWEVNPAPTQVTLVTGTHTISPSTKEAASLELNSFQQRFAHFVMAQYLFEWAQLEHRNILYQSTPDPIGVGLPPQPTDLMKELATWYAAALTLMTRADNRDNWTAGGLAVPDTRLYVILQSETQTGLMSIAQALGLVAQGFDPWGLLKRPFSTVEPQRLAEILEETIEAWENWGQQDHETNLLGLEEGRSEHLTDAADFDFAAARFARDAGLARLAQAEAKPGCSRSAKNLCDAEHHEGPVPGTGSRALPDGCR